MKKLLKIAIAVIILSVGILGFQGKTERVYAYDTDGISVDVNLNAGDHGNVKAGDAVTIKLKFNKVTDLYAASFNYTYDPTLLQVNSIDVNEEIDSAGVYAPYKDTAKEGNRARYCFTFLGDGNGLSGDYDFVTINGQAKADGKIIANGDNITCELIQRKGDNMVKNNYFLDDGEGNVYKITNVDKSQPNNNSDGSAPNNAAGSNSANKKSGVNVELIQSAGDNTKDSDKKAEENTDTKDNSSDNDEETENKSDNKENVDKKDNGEDESTDAEEEEEKAEDKGGNTSASGDENNTLMIISVIIVAAIILIAITLYLKKKRNNTK